MKMKKLALLIGLLFANVGMFAAMAESNASVGKIMKNVDTSEDAMSDNWMYLSIIAILVVLLVLIMLTFWTKKRRKKRE